MNERETGNINQLINQSDSKKNLKRSSLSSKSIQNNSDFDFNNRLVMSPSESNIISIKDNEIKDLSKSINRKK